MHYVQIITGSLAILAASLAGAQDGSEERMSSCIVEPVFHCVRHFDGGSATGYFGYILQCSDNADIASGRFVEVGDDNRFSPGRIARGQTTLFSTGEHMDEFSVDFSSKEVKAGSTIQWSVLGKAATVDFTKTKDEYLDCSALP